METLPLRLGTFLMLAFIAATITTFSNAHPTLEGEIFKLQRRYKTFDV